MFRTLLTTLLLCLVSNLGLAQSWPAKPVKIMVGASPGGGTDIIARMLGEKYQSALGQPFIVENRPGAANTIAADATAKAAPDGYTLLFANSTQLASNPAMAGKLPYDVFRDYAPVSLLARTPSMFVVSNSIPAKSLKELIALAKAKPGQLNFASQGNGTVQHVAGELFMRLTGTQMVHVPYKVYSQILTDLFTGQVALIIGGTPVLIPHVQAGRLRALAVNTQKRLPSLPDVPTFDEAGVSDFWPAPWYGVLVPAGTSARIVGTLNAAFNKTLQAADVVDTAVREGQTLLGSSPPEFAAFIKVEFARYQKLVRDTGMRLE